MIYEEYDPLVKLVAKALSVVLVFVIGITVGIKLRPECDCRPIEFRSLDGYHRRYHPNFDSVVRRKPCKEEWELAPESTSIGICLDTAKRRPE